MSPTSVQVSTSCVDAWRNAHSRSFKQKMSELSEGAEELSTIKDENALADLLFYHESRQYNHAIHEQLKGPTKLNLEKIDRIKDGSTGKIGSSLLFTSHRRHSIDVNDLPFHE